MGLGMGAYTGTQLGETGTAAVTTGAAVTTAAEWCASIIAAMLGVFASWRAVFSLIAPTTPPMTR